MNRIVDVSFCSVNHGALEGEMVDWASLLNSRLIEVCTLGKHHSTGLHLSSNVELVIFVIVYC